MGDLEPFSIENDWYELLYDDLHAGYFTQLMNFIDDEKSMYEVFPRAEDVFAALNETALVNTRVVILGQDPYHAPGQAHGFCFSVRKGVAIPPSLANIFTELQHDVDVPSPTHGCLTSWAQQGVLLLNTTLTVRRGEPGSHFGKGWERLTDRVISLVNSKDDPVVFVLWGTRARAKKNLVTNPLHLVLEAPHPSPLSAYRGFFGSQPFSQTNDFLVRKGFSPISWSLTPE
jgi:uracil-DNA glycosylase